MTFSRAYDDKQIKLQTNLLGKGVCDANSNKRENGIGAYSYITMDNIKLI